METIKRKISLDEYLVKESGNNKWGLYKWSLEPYKSNFTLGTDSYGELVPSLSLNIFITQEADDMGIGTNMDFTANTTATTIMNQYTPDIRYENKDLNDYFVPSIFITGTTSDRLNLVKSYSMTQIYQTGFNMSMESNVNTPNYPGNPYSAVNRVVSNDDNMPITYIINGNDIENIDPNNPNPGVGIFYKTYSGITNDSGGALTEMYYKGEGFNETNTTLSAITKDEYLFGITTSPTVYSDVDIDRGINSAFQSHLQLGEIRNMRDLVNYGNGYYKIQKL